MTEPTTELAQTTILPQSSQEEKRKITLSDLKAIHAESRKIAAENLPESKGIEPRRKLAKQISRVIVDREKVNREEQNRLETEGEVDALTSIYTRRGFDRRLVAEIARMKREEHEGKPSQGVLMLLDANRFKDINDVKGHDEGNRVLQRIASVITEKSRPTDIAGRLGGDEFGLFLPGASAEDAQKLFNERINPAFVMEGINISTGMADFNPYDVDQSRKNADVALYAAKAAYKETGGNELRAFVPGMVMPVKQPK